MHATHIFDPNRNSASIFNYPLSPSIFKASIAATVVLIGNWLLFRLVGLASWLEALDSLLWGNIVSIIIMWFSGVALTYLAQKARLLSKEKKHYERFVKDLELQIGRGAIHTRTFSDAEDYSADDGDHHPNPKNIRIKPRHLLAQRWLKFLVETEVKTEAFVHYDYSDFDLKRLEGSYVPLRFLLWTIPIFGFIGTVWGMSQAIGYFAQGMAGIGTASDSTALMTEGLPQVTASLATAFDTTLLALLFSVPIMALSVAMEKAERAHLNELNHQWTSIGRMLNGAPFEVSSVVNAGSEIRLLSTHIHALHLAMRDLREAVFEIFEQRLDTMDHDN